MVRFNGCWERIERADAHREAFGKSWSDFLDAEPYEATVRVENDGTGGIWVEPRYERLPVVLALELGEALYQYRAALDGCIYEAAILETGKNPPPKQETLEFPVCVDAETFKNATWKIKPITGKRRQLIEGVQPFNAPTLAPKYQLFNFNRTLAILNDWARIDRHRKLHVIGSWGANATPKLSLPPGCGLDYILVTNDGYLEHDSLIAKFHLSGYDSATMKIWGNPDLTIDVAVTEAPSPCADNDTLGNRLLVMSTMTRAIVREFESSF